MRSFGSAAITAALIGLAGCSVASPDPESDAESGSVNRDASADMAAAEQPESDAADTTATAKREPLRVGPGLAGRDAALEQVNVAGDVLTVQIRYFMPGGERGTYRTENFPVDEVSVVDDKTAQELGVLQDNRGQFLAAPLGKRDKTEIELNLYGSPVVAWFKFPAPSPETRTVSINIPGTAPFDGVEIKRY